MQRICLTLDLKDDDALIAEYEKYHEKVWPEIEKSIKDSGVITLQIYRFYTRMFMIIEAEDWFTLEAKGKADADNAKVQEWEELMWKYQQALPQAKQGEKWMLMKKIFEI